MFEIANILAIGAVMLLAVSFAAWVNSLGSPLVPIVQGAAVTGAGNQRIAAILLMAAVGISAVAAVLAIAARIS